MRMTRSCEEVHPKMRWILLGLIATVLVLPLATAVPVQAQAKRTIKIVATSFKFEPSIITVRQGETIVLELVNGDAVADGRNHSINSELLAKVTVTTRGELAAEGTAAGRRFFAFAPGKTIEVEFVASERGTFGFICGISDHAARGQAGAINVLLPASP